MTVLDERWSAFDLDPKQRQAFEKALAAAGYKVHKTLNRVPYDKTGSALDGPEVREILRAIKAGRVPSPARPAPPKKAATKKRPAGKPKPKKINKKESANG